jgi:hypothetical protein
MREDTMDTGLFSCPVCGGPLDSTEKGGSITRRRERCFSCRDKKCRTVLYQPYDKRGSDYIDRITLAYSKLRNNDRWREHSHTTHTAKEWQMLAEGKAIPDIMNLEVTPALAAGEGQSGTKTCPFCAEEILAAAIKCKHCGEMLSKPQASVNQQNVGSPVLRRLGIIIFIGGLIYGVYYLGFFDSSVAVPREEILGQVIGGGRVHNLGLMQTKQNGIMLGFGAAAFGLILALIGEYMGPGAKR